MKLWLDDIRAAPDGWTHARTVAEAILHLSTGLVAEASLDHDLDVCGICHEDPTDRAEPSPILIPCTEHERGNGIELVDWMIRTGVWPESKPRVHSSNNERAAIMRDRIESYWRHRVDLENASRFTCWVAGGDDAAEVMGWWHADQAASAFALGRWRLAGRPDKQIVHVLTAGVAVEQVFECWAPAIGGAVWEITPR